MNKGGITQNERDERSVFVKNVHFSAQKSDIEEEFKSCGKVNHITIRYDKASGKPLGHVYIEFESKQAAVEALQKNGAQFKGRPLTVVAKRTNERGKGFKPRVDPMTKMVNLMMQSMRGRGRGRGKFGFDPSRGRGRGGMGRGGNNNFT